MFWRQEKGESWANVKGETAKKRFKKLVMNKKAHGVLAYQDSHPVGWCSYDKRTEYAKLNRAPSLQCKDAEQVWSLPCFFIKAGHRNQGVATALLSHALKALKKRRAKIAEGYPVKPPSDGKPVPAAFAWTGTRPLFLKKGFSIVGNKTGGKQRVRLVLFP
jgi:GNAT superfamily N-acetyltransferase